MRVEHFMTMDPVACEADDPLEIVARQMRDKGVGSVVCLRDGKVAGIVTDRQVAIAAFAEGLPPDTPVSEVMTVDPARCSIEDNVFAVLDTMRSAGLARRVPVVNENNELVGIVSISDVAVIAQDLLDAILLEETHHAMVETRIMTGGKRIVKRIRRPTRIDKLPPEPPVHKTVEATPEGPYVPGGGNPPSD